MKVRDMIRIAVANLLRTKLRTTLTILGVVVGIGALTSMISFGTGIEKNITDVFYKNDLFTSMYITARKIEIGDLSQGEVKVDELFNREDQPGPVLNDSTVETIRHLEGVELAFPEISFRAKLRINGSEQEVEVAGLPMVMENYPPYHAVTFGEFYENDSSSGVLISWQKLKQFKILVDDPEDPIELTEEELKNGFRILPPDSLIGKPVSLVTAVMNLSPIKALSLLTGEGKLPVREKITPLVIGGIIKGESAFGNRNMRGDVVVPYQTARNIPRLPGSNILELLSSDEKPGTYNSVYVRVSRPSLVDGVIRKIKDLGFNVLALSDQLKEVRKGFLIMEGILSAVGTIALFVAALGIMNTMIMSILERTREIGIMKAIGGSENQILLIFFVEAAIIGFVGGVFGLALGWMVTRISNFVANSQFLPVGEAPVDFFYFPWWLILGALLFSMIVSLLAGVYPAIRASRVDPVRALRHD